MSLPQFFLKDQVIAQETEEVFPLRLTASDTRHAAVLRLAPGEHLAVVDASQDCFECEIVAMNEGTLAVRVCERASFAGEGPWITLVQGLAKGEKMDEVVRHATEVGVSEVMPLACARSVVKLDARKAAARRERWRSIAKSAAMQAGRRIIPDIAAVSSVPQACAALSQATAVLVCWEEAPETALLAQALESALAAAGCSNLNEARIAVIVGPEGGLTQEEVAAFLGANPQSSLITLGPTILRTETAGVVAPALVLYELRRRQETLSAPSCRACHDASVPKERS